MNRRYKGEGELFWIFLIFIFVGLPLGKGFLDKIKVDGKIGNLTITTVDTDSADDTASVDASPKMTNRAILRGAQEIEVTSNHASTSINRQVKFKLSDEAVKVVLTSPDGKKVPAQMKSSYGYFQFETVGDWEAEGYNQHGLIVDWFKINVY